MKIIPNFVSQEDVSKLIDFINSKDLARHQHSLPAYDGRQMIWNVGDEEFLSIMRKYIVLLSKESGSLLYPHDIGLLKYYPGVGMATHSDQDGPCAGNCTHTSIIQLGDFHVGGEVMFPNVGKTFSLGSGDALFFYQVGREADHAVGDIKSGERYVIITCWTAKKDMVREPYQDIL